MGGRLSLPVHSARPAMKIPSLVLRQLYTNGSLTPSGGGVRFSLKNRLMDAQLTALHGVTFDGQTVPAEALTLEMEDGATLPAGGVSEANPVDFPLKRIVHVHVPGVRAGTGV